MPVVAGPSLVMFVSPGLLTVAVLAASGLLTFDDSDTSNNNMELPLAGIALPFIHVTFGTTPIHVQPEEEPAFTL